MARLRNVHRQDGRVLNLDVCRSQPRTVTPPAAGMAAGGCGAYTGLIPRWRRSVTRNCSELTREMPSEGCHSEQSREPALSLPKGISRGRFVWARRAPERMLRAEARTAPPAPLSMTRAAPTPGCEVPASAGTTEPAGEVPASAGTTEPAGEVPASAGTTEPAGEVPASAGTTEPAGEVPASAGTTEPAGEVPASAGTTKPAGEVPASAGTTEPSTLDSYGDARAVTAHRGSTL